MPAKALGYFLHDSGAIVLYYSKRAFPPERTLRMFLYHYYPRGCEPFRSLSDLPQARAAAASRRYSARNSAKRAARCCATRRTT